MKKSKSNMEIRTLPLEELRINNLEEKRFIEGHAAVFDSWSETLGGIFPFKEKVRKGAFSQTIEKDDIRALFNHDPNYVLGRNKAGTLELKEDERGLYVRIIPPDTQAARDLITSIERGDINQMSFGFMVEEEKWDTVDGVDVRELRRVRLFDVSPVTFPAYPSTDVGVRAMESYENYRAEVRNKEEMKSRAAEKAAAKRKVEILKTKWRYL